AESFETLESYDRQIEQAAYYFERPGLIPPGDHAVRWLVVELPDRRRRREWRTTRQAPQKCIECGSTDVVVLSRDGRPSDVPDLGKVHHRCVGLCSSEGICRSF